MDDLRMLARLNDETQPFHGAADEDVDRYLFRRAVAPVDYRTYLSRIYGFVLPVESALTLTPGLGEVIDIRARAKAALIVHDLLALGLSMTEVNELPQCPGIPELRGPAAALGWLYVIERPLLSSAVVRGHLSSHLRAEMTYASAYLSCYSGQVGAMWRELGTAMDHVAYNEAIARRLVEAAQDAFRCLQRWRTHDLSQLASVRVAG